MKTFFTAVILFSISTIVFSETIIENKKRFGGPKSDYVLDRKEFNFRTSVKDTKGNWITSKKYGEIVRYGMSN
jgi:hypothetical protein|tara:strand:- start:589 stop:807 length:219 start_codon:yes stop_codon:yes gene_type:complete